MKGIAAAEATRSEHNANCILVASVCHRTGKQRREATCMMVHEQRRTFRTMHEMHGTKTLNVYYISCAVFGNMVCSPIALFVILAMEGQQRELGHVFTQSCTHST